MIIIIEGIDRVGKTTLANKLSEQFGIPIFKQERIGGNDETSVDNAIANYNRALDMVDKWKSELFTHDIIMDRFHWTEAVYSLVDRNDKNQVYRMNTVENIMLEDKDKYFVILVMPVNLYLCSREHGKDLSKHNHNFNYIYAHSKLDKYRCSYYSFDMAVKEVGRRLYKRWADQIG